MSGCYFTVTVAYMQGLVRSFAVPAELPALFFAQAVCGLGRPRRMDFERGEYDRAAAELLARTGGAVLLDMRGQREEAFHE